GLAGAQHNLGVMYAKGHGVPQDYAEARRWYRRAAEQGLAGGPLLFGPLFFNRQGGPHEFLQTHLFVQSFSCPPPPPSPPPAPLPPGPARAGAVRARDPRAQGMPPAQLAQAQAPARTWQPKPEPPQPHPETPAALLSPPPPPSQPQDVPLVWRVQARLKAVGF